MRWILLCISLGLASLGSVLGQVGKPVYHQLKPNEHLMDLSQAYGIPMEQLRAWNKLGPYENPLPGSWLIVEYDATPQPSFLGETSETSWESPPAQVGPQGEMTVPQASNTDESYIATRSLGGNTTEAPQAQVYEVNKGDTYYGISRKFGIPLEELMRLNGRTKDDLLRVGEDLIVGYGIPQQPSDREIPPAENAPGRTKPSLITPMPYHHSVAHDNKAAHHDPISAKRLKLIHEMEALASELPNFYAMFVGIADYPHVRKLKYSDDDAFRFYAFLRSVEGGAMARANSRVLVDESATRENILKNMRDVFAKAGESDYLLFYFAGHGVHGALVPVDSDGNGNLLYLKEIQALFDASPAKHKILILDACYAGELARYEPEHVTNTHINQFHESMGSEVKVAFAITSCSATQEALEIGGAQQGIFTYYLINGLEGAADLNGDLAVTIGEMFSYLEENITRHSRGRQVPRLMGYFDMEGILTFVRRREKVRYRGE